MGVYSEGRAVDLSVEAVNFFGETAQLEQAMEELAECLVEVNHAKRGRGYEGLAEELADVLVVAAQLEFILARRGIDVWPIVAKKRARLRETIDRLKSEAP